jgi:transposase
MKRKRTYKAAHVEQVRVERLLPVLAAGCIVALDVAKQKFLVALATLAGEVVELFRFDHPTETRRFLSLVSELRAHVAPGQLKAAMEPTGTYGEAIRAQLVAQGVPVCMVSPKRTHDSQALFDNVSSLHDAKSAVLVAKLCSLGLASEWAAPDPTRRRLRALIELRGYDLANEEQCFGRIEALLARHWPEFALWMDVREQKSALKLIAEYPNPAHVYAEHQEVRVFLRKTSRNRLSSELIEGALIEAGRTLGLPMLPEEELQLGTLAKQALELRQRTEALEAEMEKLAEGDEVFGRLKRLVGTYTAAVIVTLCDPRLYAKARQLEKAAGLNLREKSSGEHVGRVSLTKRGPGLVRKVLYLFTLRMIQTSSVVRAWYMRRRGYTEETKQRAVVAVMRKLVRAIFHVARGDEFDDHKLFDVRRLDLDAVNAPTPRGRSIKRRSTPRGIARGKKRARVIRPAVAST